MTLKVDLPQLPGGIQKRSHVKRRRLESSAVSALRVYIETLALNNAVKDRLSHLPTLSNARKHGFKVHMEQSVSGELDFLFEDPADGRFLRGKSALRRRYAERGWAVVDADEKVVDGLPVCPIEAEIRVYHKIV